MERIVSGISAISFHQTSCSNEVYDELQEQTENRPPNSIDSVRLANCVTNFMSSPFPAIEFNSFRQQSELPSAAMSEDCSDANDQRDVLVPAVRSHSMYTTESIFDSETASSTSTRRSCPSRASKEKSMLKIKRRSIVKPKRISPIPPSVSNMRPADIKKIYLQATKLKNFRPTNLETIFEEPESDNNSQLTVIGAKKLKRSLSCSDGLNVTKTLVKSRRLRVKKLFGRRFALKKISLDDFLEKMNASFVDEDFSESTGADAVNPRVNSRESGEAKVKENTSTTKTDIGNAQTPSLDT